jgi:phosphohistidine swiveling domain-containing protein
LSAHRAHHPGHALHEVGSTVLSIVGVRSVDLLLWEERMQAISDELIACTGDGSYGCEALVIAREYGIPAVLGTGVATERIQFGQTIRVDGDARTVTLLDEVVK